MINRIPLEYIDIIGYMGLVILCMRLIPPTLYNIWKRKKIDIASSFLALEAIGCVCYIIYGYRYNINILLRSNSIILTNVIGVVVYNNYCKRYHLNREGDRVGSPRRRRQGHVVPTQEITND